MDLESKLFSAGWILLDILVELVVLYQNHSERIEQWNLSRRKVRYHRRNQLFRGSLQEWKISTCGVFGKFERGTVEGLETSRSHQVALR